MHMVVQVGSHFSWHSLHTVSLQTIGSSPHIRLFLNFTWNVAQGDVVCQQDSRGPHKPILRFPRAGDSLALKWVPRCQGNSHCVTSTCDFRVHSGPHNANSFLKGSYKDFRAKFNFIYLIKKPAQASLFLVNFPKCAAKPNKQKAIIH